MLSSSTFAHTGIPVPFQFSQASYSVIRGEAVELVIMTSNTLTFNTSITLMATGGNATEGKYYNKSVISNALSQAHIL